VRRLLLALDEPAERFGFRLGWSIWRRRHQAVARRCHIARRAREQPVAASPAPPPLHLATSPALTDERWARVSPLLPPQRPPVGRPPRDHRTLLAGMLWVARTGAAWRDLPPSFGPWQTVHGRYQRWRQAGLWQRILAAVDSADRPSIPGEVSL
jgi:hypothetical protein